MSEQPGRTNGSPDGPDPAAAGVAGKTPRRRRWDRITLLIILAMLLVWGAALYFHRELRANYWAWRLARATSAQERGDWVRYLSAVGDVARGPAIRLTRSDKAEVRLAGVRILTNLVQKRLWEIGNAAAEQFGRGRPPAELDLPEFAVDPAVKDRFRELLGDADGRVQVGAIDGLVMIRDQSALGSLEELAKNASRSTVAVRATAALSDIDAGRGTGESLRRILHDSSDANVRVQAIDDLRWYRSDEMLAALVDALSDVREVGILPRSEQIDPALLALLEGGQFGQRPLAGPATRPEAPSSQPAWPTTRPGATQPSAGSPIAIHRDSGPLPVRRTVADYANRTLVELTRRDFGFDARASEADRDAAIRKWRKFLADHRGQAAPARPGVRAPAPRP